MALGPEEKKKVYVLLGLFGLLGGVVAVVDPFGFRSSSSTSDLAIPTPIGGESPAPGAAANATNTAPAAGQPAAGQPANGGAAAGQPAGAPAAGSVAGGAGATGAPKTILASTRALPAPGVGLQLANARPDPFQPFYRKPPPVLPPPPPPVVLPPLSIPRADDGNLAPFDPRGSRLPGISGAGNGSVSRLALANLPPVRISSVQGGSVTPRIAQPPALSTGGSALASPSGNKRLSGVIIGDSVRALLEITDADGTTTRVVQPGDEVSGIQILRIERTTENGRTQTRMYIREDGEERYVDLRASPNPPAAAAAPGGEGAPPQ